MADNIEQIQDMEDEFQTLFTRMDNDRKLYLLDKFYLRDVQGEIIKDVIHVTMPDPQIFAKKVKALVNGFSRQTVIEGLKDDEANYIEHFLRDSFIVVDKRQINRSIESLDIFNTEQIMIRGTVVSRYTARQSKGVYVPDLLPIDARYLVYEYSDDKLERVSHKTIRDGEQIEKQYPQAGRYINQKNIIVRNYWDSEVEQLYVEDQLIEEKENPYGYPPFVIHRRGSGSMFQDQGSIKYRGESIYAPVRDLYPELNRYVSILQTLTYWAIQGSYQEVGTGEAGEKLEGYPAGTRTVFVLESGRQLATIPINDIQNAGRYVWVALRTAEQQATLPALAYGNLTFPLSAVAIKNMMAGTNDILVPGLQALSLYRRDLSRMMIKQYIEGGYEAELGEEGLETKYEAKKLDKNFAIRYKFFPTTPEQNIANMAIGQQAEAMGISKHSIFKDIMEFENPDEEIMKGRLDMAERSDPVIALRMLGHSQIENEDYLGARLTLEKIKILLQQRYGEMPAEEETATSAKLPSASSLVPLFEGGGKSTPQTPMEEMETPPEPEQVARREERRAETVKRQGQGD